MSIAVITVVTFLVFVMLGFRFNRDTNTVQQGGLVQFATQPIDAKVKIGNADLTSLTPSKITVNPGRYTVTMNRSDYKPWQKTVDVRAAEVLWLTYAKLLPNSIETTNQGDFSQIAQVRSSPNGKFFAVVEDAAQPRITVVDVSSDTPKRESVEIPADILPGDTTSYAIQLWNPDSNRLLITAATPSGTKWLLLNVDQPRESINVSNRFTTPLASAQFDPRGGDRVIATTEARDLQLVDLGSSSAERTTVMTNVASVTTYNNEAITIVDAPEDGVKRISYLSLGSKKTKELTRLKTNDQVLADIASYFNDTYLAYTNGSKIELKMLSSFPSSQSDAKLTFKQITSTELPSTATYMSLRSGGRFLVSQYDGGIDTYDLELQKHTIATVPTLKTDELRWLDRYHYYVTDGAQVSLAEFDGSNPGIITQSNTVFDAVTTDNAKYFYSFNKNASGSFTLRRSQLILDN